jgi:hypothetical protein
MTWKGALALTWVGAYFDKKYHDTWHHFKGDTWHMMTWQLQLAWANVVGTSGMLTGLEDAQIIS